MPTAPFRTRRLSYFVMVSVSLRTPTHQKAGLMVRSGWPVVPGIQTLGGLAYSYGSRNKVPHPHRSFSFLLHQEKAAMTAILIRPRCGSLLHSAAGSEATAEVSCLHSVHNHLLGFSFAPFLPPFFSFSIFLSFEKVSLCSPGRS